MKYVKTKVSRFKIALYSFLIQKYSQYNAVSTLPTTKLSIVHFLNDTTRTILVSFAILLLSWYDNWAAQRAYFASPSSGGARKNNWGGPLKQTINNNM